jgi:hypothetical protein
MLFNNSCYLVDKLYGDEAFHFYRVTVKTHREETTIKRHGLNFAEKVVSDSHFE